MHSSSCFFSPLSTSSTAPCPAPATTSGGLANIKVDLLVVGASFAGLACARAAALAGLSVMVLEKKTSAGAKLHTTGIIVKDAVDSVPWLAEVPRELVRRIEGVRLYAPNMRHVDLHAPGYWFWATDAPALVDWMVDSARACGVDVRLGTLFEQALWMNDRWEVPVTHGPCITATYLVGADGPHSRVAKALGLSRNTRFLYGVEHEYQGARMAPDLLHCFIDRQLAPGYIGWALDGVGVSQIGLARRLGHNDANALRLAPFLKKIESVVSPGDAPPVAVRAGMIPCGGVLPVVARERALLVGDAAGMVSPVTAGGIHTALQHGERAGEAVARFVRGEVGDPATWFVRSYPRFLLKRSLRWAFDHFQSDWMFNHLLGTPQMRRMAELVYFHRKGGPLPKKG
ncbi:flavin-dependent dehydrogenase [Variovorax boronicumulans]|uniref:Flavin-dependent dehydrogenase n=1 Tax=Variovorax boronicumulans TaxID=436515 RepID=A0AAW8CT69_9BURK|nr:NAD(P)/FAD-dependent oxidoreductase [Variovorax boronicumulans]MDP9891434.1 flavin-dependent dehydrogenase [Variovorax boronicumulans]MDQ0051502.1 flavin-dependent dehydrogenase [Variovorax boronicumulans]